MRRTFLLLLGLVSVALVLVFNQRTIAPMHAANSSSIRFAVIGDYGWGDANEAAVANLVKSWNPDFIITLGDNNYPYGQQSTIDQNIGKYYGDYISPPTRFFPSLGNHDWYTAGAAPYLNYFTLPGNERYYDFVRGAVHFYAIDSDPNEPDGNTSTSIQATWLHNRLASSTSCWNVVYFHHSPYSSGPHGADPTDPGRNMAWQFRAWGAYAVLAGHDHIFERLNIDGIPYIVNGVGGAPLYSFVTPYVAGSQFRDNTHWGALRVAATSTQLTYEFIATSGTILNTYTQNGGCSVFLPLVEK